MQFWIEENLILIIPAAVFLLAALLIIDIVLFQKIRKINKSAGTFFSGKNGKDLESVILKQAEEIKNLDKEIQELFEISNKLYNLSFKSLHKVGIVRFNPFKDIGGDQSFAIALLNGKKSGIVVSSLHTREISKVYAKPVVDGASSKYPLTEEEKQAIEKACSSQNIAETGAEKKI